MHHLGLDEKDDLNHNVMHENGLLLDSFEWAACG